MVKEKRGTKKRKVSILSIFILLIIFILIMLAYFAFSSDYFALSEIRVEGNRVVEKNEIRDRSGLENGQNLFRLNKNFIIKEIMNQPYIKEVKISRVLPSVIVISVAEREETALLHTEDGYIVLSEDGVFLRITVEPPEGITMINNFSVDNLPGPGQSVISQHLLKALKIIEIGKLELSSSFEFISIAEEEVIAVFDGIEVKLSYDFSREELVKKFHELNIIIEQVVNKQIQVEEILYIDLRYSREPIIKKK